MAAIHLQILEVEDPHNVWAKESPGPGMTLEAESFHAMAREMSQYYTTNSDLNQCKLGMPEPGEICAGQRPSDKHWYRVRVKDVCHRLKGPEATCELLDYGKTEKIPAVSLRTLLKRFKRVPYQAKCYCLHGIQPITLVTDYEDYITTYQPCTEWDPAAVKFMEKVLKDSSDIRALTMGVDRENRQLIKLYMKQKHKVESECLNELLVDTQFAQHRDSDDNADSGLDMHIPLGGEAGYASDSSMHRLPPADDSYQQLGMRAKYRRGNSKRMNESDSESRRTIREKLMMGHAESDIEGTSPKVRAKLSASKSNTDGEGKRTASRKSELSQEKMSVLAAKHEVHAPGVKKSPGQPAVIRPHQTELLADRKPASGGTAVTSGLSGPHAMPNPAATAAIGRGVTGYQNIPPSLGRGVLAQPGLPGTGRGVNGPQVNAPAVGRSAPLQRGEGHTPVQADDISPQTVPGTGRGTLTNLSLRGSTGSGRGADVPQRTAPPVGRGISPQRGSTGSGRGADVPQRTAPPVGWGVSPQRGSPGSGRGADVPQSTAPPVGRGVSPQRGSPGSGRGADVPQSTAPPVGRGISPQRGSPGSGRGADVPQSTAPPFGRVPGSVRGAVVPSIVPTGSGRGVAMPSAMPPVGRGASSGTSQLMVDVYSSPVQCMAPELKSPPSPTRTTNSAQHTHAQLPPAAKLTAQSLRVGCAKSIEMDNKKSNGKQEESHTRSNNASVNLEPSANLNECVTGFGQGYAEASLTAPSRPVVKPAITSGGIGRGSVLLPNKAIPPKMQTGSHDLPRPGAMEMSGPKVPGLGQSNIAVGGRGRSFLLKDKLEKMFKNDISSVGPQMPGPKSHAMVPSSGRKPQWNQPRKIVIEEGAFDFDEDSDVPPGFISIQKIKQEDDDAPPQGFISVGSIKSPGKLPNKCSSTSPENSASGTESAAGVTSSSLIKKTTVDVAAASPAQTGGGSPNSQTMCSVQKGVMATVDPAIQVSVIKEQQATVAASEVVAEDKKSQPSTASDHVTDKPNVVDHVTDKPSVVHHVTDKPNVVDHLTDKPIVESVSSSNAMSSAPISVVTTMAPGTTGKQVPALNIRSPFPEGSGARPKQFATSPSASSDDFSDSSKTTPTRLANRLPKHVQRAGRPSQPESPDTRPVATAALQPVPSTLPPQVPSSPPIDKDSHGVNLVKAGSPGRTKPSVAATLLANASQMTERKKLEAQIQLLQQQLGILQQEEQLSTDEPTPSQLPPRVAVDADHMDTAKSLDSHWSKNQADVPPAASSHTGTLDDQNLDDCHQSAKSAARSSHMLKGLDMPSLEDVDLTDDGHKLVMPRSLEDAADVSIDKFKGDMPSLEDTAGLSAEDEEGMIQICTAGASALQRGHTSPSATSSPVTRLPRVKFSDVEEHLGPRKTPPGPPAKTILKKRTSLSGSDSEGAAYYTGSEEEDLVLTGIPQTSRLRNLIMPSQFEDEFAPLSELMGISQEELPSSTEVGLYIDGNLQPSPIASVAESSLADAVKESLTDHHMAEPTGLQAFMWPALLRGRDVVCVAPQRSRGSDEVARDRCLAYMMPIVTHIMLAGAYPQLPAGPGPLAIVLCSSWRRAQTVYDETHPLIKNLKTVRAMVLIGGGDEEPNDIQLINGCEILVATVHSLLRVLQRDIIQLNRMCHLVLDDGDILVEHFTDQVRSFMTEYSHELVDREDKALPRQIMLVGSQWTVGMTEFTKYMTDPLVILDSKLEAATYGQVRWRIHMCHSCQRLEQLLQMVSSFASRRTVVFTSKLQDALTISDALHKQSHHVLTVAEVLSEEELNAVNAEWNMAHQQQHYPILVATDTMVARLKVENAEQVIHYDLTEKRVFAERLWTMHQNFQLRFSEEQKESSCQSVVLVTEECTRQAPTLVRILEQCQQPVPLKLQDMARGTVEGREEGKAVALCHQLKSFGQCRNPVKCEGRHRISPELDMPGNNPERVKIPTRGELRVVVTHMTDASCYWGRLIQHRVSEAEPVKLNEEYMNLVMGLNVHMGNPSNRQECHVPIENDLFCFEDVQHTWHRVLLKRLGPRNKFGIVEKVEVEFVDRGGIDCVERQQLCQLPAKFIDIPYQAVEIFICRVKPVDGDIEWSHRAIYSASELVFKQEMDGNIVLCLGHTVWLSPLRPRISAPQGIFYDRTVHAHLINSNLAVKNDQHMKLLYAACEGRLELPEIFSAGQVPGVGYNMYGLPVSYRTETLCDSVSTQSRAFVSTVDTPQLFFLQSQGDEVLGDILQDIKQHLTVHGSDIEALDNVRVGSLVLSRLPSEDDEYMWYRGKVLEVKDDKYDVFYVDYGDREWVEKQHLRPFPTQLLRTPFQAMECELANLKPLGDEWCEADGEQLLDMTRTDKDLMKPLDATVVHKEASEFAGPVKYRLQLVERSLGFPRDVAQELVAQGYAKLTEDFCKELTTVNEAGDTIKTVMMRCEELLHATQKSQNQDHAADQVRQEVEAFLRSGEDGVSCLVQKLGHVLGYISSPAALLLILTSLELLLTRDVGEDQDLVVNMLRVLHRMENEAVRQHAVKILARLAQYAGYCMDLEYYKGIHIFSHLARDTEDDVVRKYALQILVAIVPDACSTPDKITKSRVVEVLCALICDSKDSTELSLCLQILAYLAPKERWNDTIRKCGGLNALCSRVVDVQEPEVLAELMRLLVVVTEGSLYTRDTLMEKGHLATFQRLLTGTLSPEVTVLCQEMVELLTPVASDLEGEEAKKEVIKHAKETVDVVKNFVPHVPGIKPLRVPIEAELHNTPIPEQSDGAVIQRARPQVHWMQDKRNVRISVAVHTKTEKPVDIEEGRLKFSAISGNLEYWFDFYLYELVVPEKCEVQIHNSEVLIGLKKKSSGYWNRLIKSKTKLSYLRLDFMHMIESSSDDCDSAMETEDIDLASPLAIIGKHKLRPMLPSTGPVGPGLPCGITEPAGDSSSDSDDDLPPDHFDTDKRFGFYEP